MKIKLVFAFIIMFMLSGCSAADELPDMGSFKHGDKDIYIVCLNGVEYLMINWGLSGMMAPHYDQNSKVHTCDVTED